MMPNQGRRQQENALEAEEKVSEEAHGARYAIRTSSAGSPNGWMRSSTGGGGARAGRVSEEALRVSDPSGLVFELIATDRDARTPWARGGVAAGVAIRGLHSVTLLVREPAKTLELMTGLLGFAVVGDTEGRIRVAVGGGGAGKIIDIRHDPGAEAAVN